MNLCFQDSEIAGAIRRRTPALIFGLKNHAQVRTVWFAGVVMVLIEILRLQLSPRELAGEGVQLHTKNTIPQIGNLRCLVLAYVPFF